MIPRSWAQNKVKRILHVYKFLFSFEERQAGGIYFVEAVHGYLSITGWKRDSLHPADDWADEFGEDAYLRFRFTDKNIWVDGVGYRNTLSLDQGPYEFMEAIIDEIRTFFMPILKKHMPRKSHKWILKEISSYVYPKSKI